MTSLVRALRLCAFLFAVALSCAGQLPTITTEALANATTGGAYSASLSVSGGTPPYSNWTVGAGSLPPGLSLDPVAGSISGTPSASGTFNFWITVQDSAGGISPAKSLAITTSVPVIATTASVLSIVVGTAYSYTLAVSGGTPPYNNWTVASGSLPQGLFLNPVTGVISGTPITVGIYNFTLTVQDATGVTSAPQPLTIVTGVAIITNSLPKGTLTAPYNVQLIGAGGTQPYVSWLVSSGVLPPGLTLTAGTGLLSGTPITSGSYSFSVTVTDSAATTSIAQPFTIVIAPTPVITTGALLPGLPGVPYSATLFASGGTLPLTWAITGTLPTGLSFSPGTGVISGTPQSPAGSTFNFSVQVTDAVGVMSPGQPLSIAISQAGLTLSPTSLSFSAMPGDTVAPPVQSVSIFSLSATVTFTATPTTASGGNWLSVAGGGKTPGSILVSVNTGGLSPGTTYHGTITVSGQNIAASTIPVTFTMGTGGASQLSVTPPSLPLSYVQGNPAEERYLVVSNAGGGTIHFNASATTDSCGSWLNLLTTSGSATAGSPGVIALLVNSAGLSDRSCVGSITVSDSATGQSQTVSVTMTVSAQTQSLLLSQAGMNFQTRVAASPLSQTFSVANSGVGSVNWTATPQTLSGGNWLSVSPATGTSTSGVLPIPVTVSVNSQGLPPGQYYGSVQVASNTVGNSPQAVSIMLTIANAAPGPPPLTPSGVILTGQPTGVSDIQTVTLVNPWSTPLAYNSTVVTDNRVNWLTQTPASGTIAPSATSAATSGITLQASLKGLTPGLQHGVLRVAFTDGTVHSVDIYLIVPASAISAAIAAPAVRTSPAVVEPAFLAESCPGGSGIALVFRSPEPAFQVTAQVPVPVQVTARDCSTGKAIRQPGGASVQILTAAPNGPLTSLPVTLWDDGTGIWTGTWTPIAASPQLNLIARVDQYQGAIASVLSAQSILVGTVNPAPDGAPGVVTNIFNGASYQHPGSVTPGAWVSLFGVGMGDAVASAAQTPFPNSLGGTQVLLQGQALPLYFVNSTQINALIPSGVNPNERQQLVVVRDGTQSASVDVRVANLQPGIFTVNQQGTGQGAITVGNNAQLAAPARPAKRGEYVTIYCTGLGPVTNAPRDGSPAPTSPLATTSLAPVVTIGGVAVPAVFSGLTPMQVGLYQVNVQVPQNAPAGDTVPVVLTIGNAASNTATIAVQ
jgi:uncharacterized protein (TIGR03437 family)